MYGIPQPSSYGQYGFGGYAGFPGQAAATPGTAGPGSPGMPQASAGAGGLGLAAGSQQPGADLNAAGGQAGQAQWGATDPSYYSNYWGGGYRLRQLSHNLILYLLQVTMANRPQVNRPEMLRCKVLPNLTAVATSSTFSFTC